MATISQIHADMREILGPFADQAGRTTGFTQRQSKMTGSRFAQTMVFGSQSKEELTYTYLTETAATRGVAISPQGLDQRFSKASAELMRTLLNEAVNQKMAHGDLVTDLLPFNAIYIEDSSTVSLPLGLRSIWPGVGGSAGDTAAVKLQVRLDYLSGQMTGPELQPGRAHDTTSSYHGETLPAGALRLKDLGYFDLEQFEKDSQAGVYWLSRYKVGTLLYTQAGEQLNLLAWLRSLRQTQCDLMVQVGKRDLPCRLLVQRVPQEVADQRRRKIKEYARKKQVKPSALLLALAEWTLLLTNVPVEQASLRQVMVLLKVRWQVERLFKLWKSLFKIDEWRSEKPWRILTELYAKLLGVVIFHWFTQLPGFRFPQLSVWKAAEIFKTFVKSFSVTFDIEAAFSAIVDAFLLSVKQAARLNTRSTKPNTVQKLLQWPSLA